MAPTFEQALAQLVVTRGIQYDLSRMQDALEALGHPEQCPKTIHVAGTNGKGTTSDFIAQALEQRGHTVGLYTSPHLLSYTERFRVNGVSITEPVLQTYLDRLTPLTPSLSLTEFEVLTLIAWLYFNDKAVDYAVMETGLGGRLDATVICRPVVTILTSISYDHQAILGDTIEAIAREKAGILKPGVPCFALENEPAVQAVIAKQARRLPCPLTLVPRLGDTYLAINAHLANTVVDHLLGLGQLPVGGRTETRIGGRQEQVREQPRILIDAAHNLDGIRSLVHILKKHQPPHDIWFGATRRPELKAILLELLDVTNHLTLFEFAHDRAALRADYPESLLADKRVSFVPLSRRSDHIKTLLESASRPLCITGSIYFLGEMLPLVRE
jgi:folylpolyglutamate synthase/dihydropteroate synthase